jgi:carboxymethylenebutenolidase
MLNPDRFMPGSMITFDSPSGTTPGYLALPEDVGPGVVVIQEWWGLVEHIESVVDRFAAAGFVALAPDLYHGVTTKSPDEAAKLVMALNVEQASGEIAAAASYLLARPELSPAKVGVVGFCMGGALALYASVHFPNVISACVDFYGAHPRVGFDPHQLQVPVLAHFGTRDPLTVRGDARMLVQTLSDAGKFVDAYYYDAGHAFFNETRPDAYVPDAAALAWDRTLAFLRDSLR